MRIIILIKNEKPKFCEPSLQNIIIISGCFVISSTSFEHFVIAHCLSSFCDLQSVSNDILVYCSELTFCVLQCVPVDTL